MKMAPGISQSFAEMSTAARNIAAKPAIGSWGWRTLFQRERDSLQRLDVYKSHSMVMASRNGPQAVLAEMKSMLWMGTSQRGFSQEVR